MVLIRCQQKSRSVQKLRENGRVKGGIESSKRLQPETPSKETVFDGMKRASSLLFTFTVHTGKPRSILLPFSINSQSTFDRRASSQHNSFLFLPDRLVSACFWLLWYTVPSGSLPHVNGGCGVPVENPNQEDQEQKFVFKGEGLGQWQQAFGWE